MNSALFNLIDLFGSFDSFSGYSKMEAIEIEILSRLDISNPYESVELMKSIDTDRSGVKSHE